MKPKSHLAAPPGTLPPTPIDPLDWIGETGAQRDILRAMDRQRRRRRVRTLAGTAAALLVAAIIWQLPWRSPVPATASSAFVHVPARQVLPDGSIVELKDGASVSVAFTSVFRRVELVRGEAHFQVAKNPARPFLVSVGHVEVRAVGTAFSVQRSPTQVDVLVTEGRVTVEKLANNSPATATTTARGAETIATLEVGDLTVVDFAPTAATPQVTALPAAEIRDRLSWRVPRLEFSGTFLGEAIPMINRYSGVKLVLDDSTLASVRLSGVLRADNIETLRELLSEVHGIKSEFRSETEIVLTKAR
ncbi:MAG: FecR family protein [Opitutaceae bacterium]